MRRAFTDEIAAHKQALADRKAGRPSAYDLDPALVASILAASARK